MAIFMQVIAARLGVVTGKDLAQACRDYYPAWTRWPNWLACEVAIGACDLAEVLGSAVAINLLFHIPLLWAVLITAFDVLLLLGLQGLGMRFIEAVILVLVATIGGCYFIEIFVLPQTQPSFLEMGHALLTPGFRQAGMIVVAIGIIGATVMPHNLYLHSALVQSRKLQQRRADRSAGRSSSTRSIRSWPCRSLSSSMPPFWCWRRWFSRQASVTLAGGTSWRSTTNTDWIRVAYLTLAPLLGTAWPARCSPWRCWPAARAARSPARWPARWSWKASCTGGSGRGCAG